MNLTMDEDMTLLQRWRDGDLKAGDALLRRHYRYAYRLAQARLCDEDAAAEATQHAMRIVVQKRDEIETNFRRYLGKIVYFSVLTQTKRQAKQSRCESIGDEEPRAKTTRSASSLLGLAEEEKLLVKALRSLSTDDQLLVYYGLVGERNRGEIAELLDISKKSIHPRISKAKARLRKKLEHLRESPIQQSTLGGLETWLRSIYEKSPEAWLEG